MWNRLAKLFRRKSADSQLLEGHMTFGQTSAGRTFSRTKLYLKKQLWIWPIVAIVLLATIGYLLSGAIRNTMRASLESELQTLLNIEATMLSKWLAIQESAAESLANDRDLRKTTVDLLTVRAANSTPAAKSGEPAPTQAELHASLEQILAPFLASHDYAGYIIADKKLQVVASSQVELIGRSPPEFTSFLQRAFEGEPTVSVPFASVAATHDEKGRTRTGVPTMFACAPIRDPDLQVVGVLGLRIRPEHEFTRILQLGRTGESGETFAFNREGRLVSNSRFDHDLILLGLIPDDEDSSSLLNLSLRDPGGDMTQGFRPTQRRSELPLTRMCSEAIAGRPGVDMEGYRDYRGALVVGAWTWLPKYELGIATEIDHAEAFRPLTILQYAFFSVFALLAISSVAIFVFTVVVTRLQREAQKATIKARQLGQYRLEDKIGAGAMGVVYKGHHAMLRRPTAIKLLDVDKVNEASLQRFEREVQITCQLNNPHTVAIYDYGRTPEGVFYYAMEYLDGVDLQKLVETYGPQPEGRVVSILRQICASLYEAHTMGLVHRDIKPANVMLTRRGAEPDVVKVLDFGLVKTVEDKSAAGGSAESISGTPLYMAPESFQAPDQVDGRSDLYAVGALGYFLLTGQPVFNASSLVALCQMHLSAVPEPMSQRAGRTISAELEHVILACLEKSRAKRPQTARDLSARLSRTPAADAWTADDAEAWWGRHERGQGAGTEVVGAAGASTSSAVNARPSPAAPTNPKANRTSAGGFDQTMDQG